MGRHAQQPDLIATTWESLQRSGPVRVDSDDDEQEDRWADYDEIE
jgi:hypothetical protein